MSDGGFTITRSLPELDAAINKLERLARSTEPRGTYEYDLTDSVIELAKIIRSYLRAANL